VGQDAVSNSRPLANIYVSGHSEIGQMGYKLNIVVIKGLPKGDAEGFINDLRLEGFIGNSGRHFTIGEYKKLSESLFDDQLRIGFCNGCTLITSNFLVEDFFRPFLSQFALKLTEFFPKTEILFVSVVETINLSGYTLISDNDIQRCRVDLNNKIAQYDDENLLIGKPILDEPQVLDINYLNALSLNVFGLVPWSVEISDKVNMNENIDLSSDFVRNLNDHLTKEKMIILFNELVGNFLLDLNFKYLKTKKVYVRKMKKDILFQVKPEIMMKTLFCDYRLIHNSRLITQRDLVNITLPSNAETRDESTGVRIKYNYDAIPNLHAKTVKDFTLYMNEVKSHFENTVLKDIDRVAEFLNAR
jgi:hypothetical protein